MKRSFKYLIGISAFLLALELSLRLLGFCDFPLYVSSEAYEYVHAPNQDRTIYTNRFRTNAQSMRSNPLSKSSRIRLLLIGDSIINGGNNTDHDELASTLLEEMLSDALGVEVQVLNVSSGSWGPDNGVAYLSEHGLFDVDLICGVYSSHDAYDVMTHEGVVGKNPNYPEEQSPLALLKLAEKLYEHLDPYMSDEYAPHRWNSGFAALDSVASANKIPLLFYVHAEKSEFQAQQRTAIGKELQQFMEAQGYEWFDELAYRHNDPSNYRDNIHFNAKGQAFLAENLFEITREKLAKLL